jgi:hypothetical protein
LHDCHIGHVRWSDELRETTVPAPEVTVVINSDIPHSRGQGQPSSSRGRTSPRTNLGLARFTPRLCVALLVVRPACLTPEFLLGRKGSNPNRHNPDDMSTSSSSAMEVLTAATSAAKSAVFVETDVLHCHLTCLAHPPATPVGVRNPTTPLEAPCASRRVSPAQVLAGLPEAGIANRKKPSERKSTPREGLYIHR